MNAKVFPFRGDEKKKERKERKGEIGGSFSFISPTPRFENLKTRRGVAQVRIAQTQSTHQSRGTDAYRWARVFSIFDERSFSKRVYNRRSAGKGITGKGKTVNKLRKKKKRKKKEENLSLHVGDYYRSHHAPIIKFNMV